MMRVRTKKDYRDAYDWIAMLEKALAANGFGKPDFVRDDIIEQKREMRRWANMDSAVDVGMGFMVDSRVVQREEEDAILLQSIPEVFDDEASAEEFFEEFLKYHYYPSPYDCTGQTFTRWHKLFKRGGRYWVYHAIGMDI